MPSVLARTIVTDAAKELGVASQGETLTAGDAQDLLSKLNRLLDTWNAEPKNIYAERLISETTTASLQPHTLGNDGATWAVDIRPPSIVSATIIATGAIRTPLAVLPFSTYADLTTPEDTGVPEALYVNAEWPNSELYFWPIPDGAYTVKLLCRIALNEVTLDDEVYFPPGYQDAITLTLAEESADMFGRPMPPSLPSRASKKRATIQSNNTVIPRLTSDVAGSCGSTWDYRTGR
jgi:hypothetical protein